MKKNLDSESQQIQAQQPLSSEEMIRETSQQLEFPYIKNSLDNSRQSRSTSLHRKKEKRNEKKDKKQKGRSSKNKGKDGKKIKSKNNLKKYFLNKYSKFLMSGLLVVFLLHSIIYLVLGQDQKFDIKININPELMISNISIRDLGLIENPQVATVLDIFNITSNIEFTRFQKQYSDKYKSKLEVISGKLKIKQRKKLESEQSMENIQISPLYKNEIKKYAKTYPQLIGIAFRNGQYKESNVDQLVDILDLSQLQKIEQKYVDLKYNISSLTKNNQFCVLVYSFIANSKIDSFNKNLNAIINQNYEEYRIFVIDDASPESITDLVDRNLRKNLKISIVRNKIKTGKDSSFFIHSKFCRPQQIIVYFDSTFQLIGFENLNILNSFFQNENSWVVYPSFIEYRDNFQLKETISREYKPQSYNRFNIQIQAFPQVLAHRGQLIHKFIPEYFFEYAKVEQRKPYYTPVFHVSKSMKFLTYCILEMSGDLHTQFIDHTMYVKQKTQEIGSRCLFEQNMLIEQKARIKTPLNQLQKLSDFPSFKSSQKLPQPLQKELSRLYLEYKKCLENKRRIELKK